MPDVVPIRRTLTVYPNKGMWTYDTAEMIPDGTSPDMLNFQIYGGYIRKRPGYVPYGVTFPTGPITGLVSAQQSAGGRALYGTNTTGLYKYDPATGIWTAQTGPALTGGSGNLFSFEISQNCLVFCQGVDNIMSLDLTGTVYAVINANAKPAKYLSRWNNRLYTAFTVEGGVQKPFRLRWSANSDHTDWVGVGSGFNDLTDDVYQIRGIKKLVDVLVVYCEKNANLGTKTGLATGPADFATQIQDIGLAAPYTLQRRNTIHLMLGTDNIYIFDGVQIQPIGDPIRTTLYGTLNPAALTTNFGAYLYASQEYAIFVSTTSEITCDTAWVYNLQRSAFYPWKFGGTTFTAHCSHFLDFNVKISDLVGTIAAQTWILGGGTLTQNVPVPIFGAVDGTVHVLQPGSLSDNGSAILCRWTSKDYTARDIDPSFATDMLTMTSLGISYVDPGAPFTLQVYFSTDRGVSWDGPFPVTCNSAKIGSIGDVMVTRQTTGKRIRFKVENSTTNENPQISAFSPTLELKRQRTA